MKRIRNLFAVTALLCTPAFAQNCILSGVTDQYTYFVAVDSTDFTSRETGLATWTVYRSRNGAAAAAFTTPTINETDTTNMPGVYELLLDEDMTIDAGDDVQHMALHITHTGMAPVTKEICIARAKATAGNTLAVDASGNGASDLIEIAGSAVSTSTAQLGVNVVNAAGTAWASGAITAASIATDAIGAAEIAADAIGASELATDAIGAAEIAADAIGASEIANNAIAAAEIAAGAIDAATFAADVDAEILSYLVDDATQIDASALNTASVTSIPAILVDTGTTLDDFVDGIEAALANVVLVGPTAIGATGNSTTAVHLDGLTYGNDEINGYFLVLRDISEGEYHWRQIEDWVLATELATVATLPFTPEDSTDTFAIIATLGAADVTGGDATAANQSAILAALGTPSDLGGGATLSDNLVDIEGQTDDIGAAGAGLTEAGGTGDQFTAIDIFSISGDSTAANSLEAILDLQAGANGAFPMLGIIASGTAQAYTAGTPSVTLAASTAAADDDFNGGTILVLGSNEGDWQSATISDYAGATDIATIDAALTTAPTGTISYIVFGTAEGAGGGASAAEVWAYSSRILTALDEDSTTIDLDASTVGTVSSVTAVATGGITAASIAADAIGESELATGAITAAEIAADAIGASELAANAIGAAEVADATIDAATFAAGAIDASAIAADAIGASEVATDAIGAAEIAANAIGAAEIANGALDDSAVDNDALGDGTALTEAGGTGDHLTAVGGLGSTAQANVRTALGALNGTCDSGSTTTCVDNAFTQADATQLDERLICFDDDWCSLIDSFTPGTDTVTTTKTAPSTRASRVYTIYPATAQ